MAAFGTGFMIAMALVLVSRGHIAHQPTDSFVVNLAAVDLIPRFDNARVAFLTYSGGILSRVEAAKADQIRYDRKQRADKQNARGKCEYGFK